jgi:hypothetical protein
VGVYRKNEGIERKVEHFEKSGGLSKLLTLIRVVE